MRQRNKRKRGPKDFGKKGPSGGPGQSFNDYNPANVNPLTSQFESDPANPIQSHKMMAGVK